MKFKHYFPVIYWKGNGKDAVGLQSVMTQNGPMAVAVIASDQNSRIRITFCKKVCEWFYREYVYLFTDVTGFANISHCLDRRMHAFLLEGELPEDYTILLMHKKQFFLAYAHDKNCYMKKSLIHRRIGRTKHRLYHAEYGRLRDNQLIMVSRNAFLSLSEKGICNMLHRWHKSTKGRQREELPDEISIKKTLREMSYRSIKKKDNISSITEPTLIYLRLYVT